MIESRKSLSDRIRVVIEISSKFPFVVILRKCISLLREVFVCKFLITSTKKPSTRR